MAALSAASAPIYSGGGTPESEEEGQRVMAAWQQWLGDLGDAVVDQGAPFAGSAAVKGGTTSGLSGYSILTAASLDDAVAKAEDCPIFASGGGVEVYETVEM
jgi:hypothetical protein